MEATATATRPSRAPARRAPARKPSVAPTVRRPRAAKRQTTGWLVPVAAVGRTVLVVGGIADSGLVHRLTRGRLWIGLLGALLVGIVALNVLALSFSASASNTARETDELKRLNSAARAQLASQLSSDELQQVASKLGLVVPAPNQISYLKPSAEDAETAAQRLRNGELTGAAPAIVPLQGALAP